MATRASRSSSPNGARTRRQAGAERRVQILRALEAYWQEHGRPPTIRVLGAAVGIRTPSVMAYYVDALEREGLLRRERGSSRGLFPTRPLGGPHVLGAIAAGEPLDLFDTGEPERLELGALAGALRMAPTISVSGAAANGEVYALRVQGVSMIEDGILDGDYVLIAPGPQVTNGAIAVVIHQTANGGRGAATLKRVYVERSNDVRLQPANAALSARRVTAEEWRREWCVQGTALAVIRPFS